MFRFIISMPLNGATTVSRLGMLIHLSPRLPVLTSVCACVGVCACVRVCLCVCGRSLDAWKRCN